MARTTVIASSGHIRRWSWLPRQSPPFFGEDETQQNLTLHFSLIAGTTQLLRFLQHPAPFIAFPCLEQHLTQHVMCLVIAWVHFDGATEHAFRRAQVVLL